MTPVGLLATLRAEGVRVVALEDGRLSLVPTPRPDLLRLAIAAKPALLCLLAAEAGAPPAAAPPPPEPELVARLAATLAGPRPWQRVTDPENAAAYFAAQARRLLLACPPPDRPALVEKAERATPVAGSATP
jgi:hypothetical protein